MDISDITEQQIIDLIEFDNQDLVDIPDYEGLYKFNIKTNKVYNCISNKWLKATWCNRYYRITLIKNKKEKGYYLHRLVYICNNLTEDINSFEIDHIDKDRKNNNINNLRKATHSENCRNASVRKDNLSTGYKNIHMRKNKTKKNNLTSFIVKIAYNKKTYYKTFHSLEDAIIHRDIKLLELHKEFANYGK